MSMIHLHLHISPKEMCTCYQQDIHKHVYSNIIYKRQMLKQFDYLLIAVHSDNNNNKNNDTERRCQAQK